MDFRSSDDAGVFLWEGGPALVQTVDFFTPIVDDPYLYGQIAAANSISDVYAMGAKPLTALAIAGFPKSGLSNETIGQIFRGGLDKLQEAGIALLGGHTVQDPEIKFGYAITGAVDPKKMLTNANVKVGDRLILTKPIGTGVIGTAMKFKRCPQAVADRAVEAMRTLNKAAAETQAKFDSVHACTDITGFALIGHASEMAVASGATIVFDAARIPLFDGAVDLVRRNRNAGIATNRGHFGSGVKLAAAIDAEVLDLFYDPQTSGGLLISVAAEQAEALLAALIEAGVPAVEIGRAIDPSGSFIELR